MVLLSGFEDPARSRPSSDAGPRERPQRLESPPTAPPRPPPSSSTTILAVRERAGDSANGSRAASHGRADYPTEPPRGSLAPVRYARARARARGRVRGPGADDAAVGGVRRRRRGHADRPERRVRVRLLEARRDVRAGRARGRPPPLRGHRQARRALRSGDGPSRSIRSPGACTTDAGTFEADVLVVALGRRPRPGGDAGPGRGRPRVLHGRGRLRRARRARRLRGRPRDRRRPLDAVQVPTGAERDGAAAARLPGRARAARPLRDRARDGLRPADPAFAGRVGGCSNARSPSAESSGIRAARSASSTRPAASRTLRDGGEMPYDLFLAVPVHRAPAVVSSRG